MSAPLFDSAYFDEDVASRWLRGNHHGHSDQSDGADDPITILQAYEEAGYDYLPDQNGEFRDGYFPITISNAYERRVSSAIGYLDPGTRLRDNLSISTNTRVRELLFEGSRCVGVKALVGGREEEFRGNEIILSSGAIHSPAHLLRAGIGPAMALGEMGIPVLANLAGVGQGLMDHPSVAVASFVKPHARVNDHTRRHMLVGLRYSSDIEGAPRGDMFVAVASKSSWHAVGEQIASMVVFVNKTYSETGQVKLASADWRDEPEVEFNLLSDRRDLDRLMESVRKMAALHALPVLRGVTSDPFPASYSDKVRQVGLVNQRNKLLTGFMAKLLDGPDTLRRYLIEKLIMEDFSLDDVLRDDGALETFVRKAAVGVWHASCSCRMGADDDPKAVTDTTGRVRGIGNLRVVDASIFPVVPCANTNFPTLMTAEKIADGILAGD